VTAGEVIGFINLFCVGILAGEEFVLCYGVRAPLASLDERSHIQLRQALIRRLVVVVPALFALSILSGVAAPVRVGFSQGLAFCIAGLLALLTFITVTLLGTVPINSAALTWDPGAPPKNWRTLVRRWERLDLVRCWAAITAFAFFLTATALHLAGS